MISRWAIVRIHRVPFAACKTISHYIIVQYTMLPYYDTLCYAIICYARLCYGMLCYAMLCYVILCFMTALASETTRAAAVRCIDSDHALGRDIILEVPARDSRAFRRRNRRLNRVTSRRLNRGSRAFRSPGYASARMYVHPGQVTLLSPEIRKASCTHELWWSLMWHRGGFP